MSKANTGVQITHGMEWLLEEEGFSDVSGKCDSDFPMYESKKKQFGNPSYTLSQELRKKISDSLRGRKSSEETRAKISAASRLHVHTDEAKAKISAANRGKVVSAEARAKISAANQARKAAGYVPATLTAEQREKIGAAHRGKVMSEQTRAKLRAHNVGKKKSPQAIAKQKATWKAKRIAKQQQLLSLT